MPNKHTHRTTKRTHRNGVRGAQRSKSIATKPAGGGGLTAAALKKRGAALVGLIMEARASRGLTYEQVAKQLRMHRNYLLLLRKGKREISNVSNETMESIASFLGIAPVLAMLAGGQLRLEHFYQSPEVLHQSLGQALTFIQRDPDLGPYMPATAFSADADLQGFILLLYERATGKTLIPGRVSLEDIAKSYEALDSESEP